MKKIFSLFLLAVVCSLVCCKYAVGDEFCGFKCDYQDSKNGMSNKLVVCAGGPMKQCFLKNWQFAIVNWCNNKGTAPKSGYSKVGVDGRHGDVIWIKDGTKKTGEAYVFDNQFAADAAVCRACGNGYRWKSDGTEVGCVEIKQERTQTASESSGDVNKNTKQSKTSKGGNSSVSQTSSSVNYTSGANVGGDDNGRSGTVEGVKGIIYETNPDRGGAAYGHCDGKEHGSDCTQESRGALTASCEWYDKAHTKLTCTTRECDESRDYVLRKGFGVCWTKDRAEKYCREKKKNCNSETEVPSPVFIDNPYNKRGKAFNHECFCANRNPVTYTCGAGTGQPPVDSETYTNVNTVTVKENTCQKQNATFKNWLCGNKTFNPGDTFTISGKIECVAQWDDVKPNTSDGYYGKVIDATTKEAVSQANVYLVKDSTKGCITDSSGEFGKNPECSFKLNEVQVSHDGYKSKEATLEKGKENIIELEPLSDVQIESGCGPNKHPDESGDCVCNEGLVPEGDNCVTPTKCPDGATGNYPDCNCTPPKTKYDNSSNTCKCPDDKPYYDEASQKCIVKCPDGATGQYPNCKCSDKKKLYDKNTNECVDNKIPDLEEDYKKKKENEQSLANRTLTAATTAATGIGGMELAMGLAEQNADKKAEADMAAYIETFRCTYGNGQSVKGGPEPVELPGGNDATMMSLQNEYKTLAASLKERKESLGMKPGIESELILDKAEMGLYDQENVGITGGAYSSLYRAMALNSESDQSKINADKEASANRVKYGGIAAGAGVVGGVVGNMLINNGKDKEIDTKDTKEELVSKVNSYVSDSDVKEKLTDKNTYKSYENKNEPQGESPCEDIDKCLKDGGSGYRGIDGEGNCFVPEENPDNVSTNADMEKCAGLITGEWEVNFSYGDIKGTYKCAENEAVTIPNKSYLFVPGTPKGDGDYCWCTATSVPYSVFSTSTWVQAGTKNSSCSKNCGHLCAIFMWRYEHFRESMLGFYKEQ